MPSRILFVSVDAVLHGTSSYVCFGQSPVTVGSITVTAYKDDSSVQSTSITMDGSLPIAFIRKYEQIIRFYRSHKIEVLPKCRITV